MEFLESHTNKTIWNNDTILTTIEPKEYNDNEINGIEDDIKDIKQEEKDEEEGEGEEEKERKEKEQKIAHKVVSDLEVNLNICISLLFINLFCIYIIIFYIVIIFIFLNSIWKL